MVDGAVLSVTGFGIRLGGDEVEELAYADREVGGGRQILHTTSSTYRDTSPIIKRPPPQDPHMHGTLEYS